MSAGQVAASDAVLSNVRGFPSEKELSESVRTLPDLLNGKYMGQDSDILPVLQAGQIIKLSIERGKWKFLKRKDTFSLVDSAGEPFALGAHITVKIGLLGKNRIVLKDKDEVPICLVVEERTQANHQFDIYGRNSLYQGDAPKEKENEVDFYPWYRVRTRTHRKQDFLPVLVWDSCHYDRMLRIYPAKHFEKKHLVEKIPIVKNLLPSNTKRHVVVCDTNDESLLYACMSKKSEHVVHPDQGMAIKSPMKLQTDWDLVIAPGADPVMFIMLTTIMDDLVGWFS